MHKYINKQIPPVGQFKLLHGAEILHYVSSVIVAVVEVVVVLEAV